MRNVTFAIVLAMGLLGASMAAAQDKMAPQRMGQNEKMHHRMQPKMGMRHMDAMSATMMHGLTADEMKTAMAMSKTMSPAEKAAVHKHCMMCMKDKKMAMMGAQKSMMAGMSPREQATMKKMWGRMSAKERAVAMKMTQNCCAYGTKHGM